MTCLRISKPRHDSAYSLSNYTMADITVSFFPAAWSFPSDMAFFFITERPAMWTGISAMFTNIMHEIRGKLEYDKITHNLLIYNEMNIPTIYHWKEKKR